MQFSIIISLEILTKEFDMHIASPQMCFIQYKENEPYTLSVIFITNCSPTDMVTSTRNAFA